MQWWTLPTTPIRPSSSRSAIQTCHSGRWRGSGFDMHSSITSPSRSDLEASTCREMSKSRSSVHTGALIPNGTDFSVCRYRGARGSRRAMCSRSCSKLGLTPSPGGSKTAAQPTCMWAVGVSTARNEASSDDRRLFTDMSLSSASRKSAAPRGPRPRFRRGPEAGQHLRKGSRAGSGSGSRMGGRM